MYLNESEEQLEAKYKFPLDAMAAVCGFEAFINGKHVVGTVKEKEQAKREYTEAVAKGHGAYLMEEADEGEVFTITVGNLPPRAECLIKITYVTELAVAGVHTLITVPQVLRLFWFFGFCFAGEDSQPVHSQRKNIKFTFIKLIFPTATIHKNKCKSLFK